MSNTNGSITSGTLPPIPDSIRKMVAYDPTEEELLVSGSHKHFPPVLSFKARLQKMGFRVPSRTAPMEEIHALISSQSELRGSNSTGMLPEIKRLFVDAMKQKATDIHIQVHEEYAQVKLRIHGVLIPHKQWTDTYAWSFCSALYTSMTDVSETTFNPLERQDARIGEPRWLPAKMHSVRVATSPTDDGFLMCLRLLYENFLTRTTLEGLGYNERQCRLIEAMKYQTNGLNVIAGPTGSGKSTTLKCILEDVLSMHERKINVITVEDPPEYPIKGVVQTPVTGAETEAKRTEAFNRAIAGTMRMDPDVIMIGEVRDRASAKLALRAAMTGHQVWTTLHASSAFGILDRLNDLGIPLNMLAQQEVLSGAVFQRLVQTLCPECRIPLSRKTNEALTNFLEGKLLELGLNKSCLFIRGEGCDACGGTGVNGRTVVAEVMLPNREILECIRERKLQDAHDLWLEGEGVPIRRHMIQKVNDGWVDPNQLFSLGIGREDFL